jgi:hypothetical protein
MSKIPELDREISIRKQELEGVEPTKFQGEDPYDFQERVQGILEKYYEENGLFQHDDMWDEYHDKINEVFLKYWGMG